MDEQIDRLLDGWLDIILTVRGRGLDGWLGGWTDGLILGQMVGLIDGQLDKMLDSGLDGWMDEWMVRWIDYQIVGQTVGYMDGQLYISFEQILKVGFSQADRKFYVSVHREFTHTYAQTHTCR